jgi:hypothetical protein
MGGVADREMSQSNRRSWVLGIGINMFSSHEAKCTFTKSQYRSRIFIHFICHLSIFPFRALGSRRYHQEQNHLHAMVCKSPTPPDAPICSSTRDAPLPPETPAFLRHTIPWESPSLHVFLGTARVWHGVTESISQSPNQKVNAPQGSEARDPA